jgi:hypothetical protein
MATPRRPYKVTNFDGESISLTRDIFEFSSRRRKALLAKLADIPQLEGPDQEHFHYTDRGRLLGFVSIKKDEVWIDGNSVERTDQISRDIVAACGNILKFARRVEHDEVASDPPFLPEEVVRDPDQPIGDMRASLRELFKDPETRARAQAQLPPGVNLSDILDGFPGDPVPYMDFEDDDDPDGDLEMSGFATVALRLDLLDGPPGCYWMLKVPDWITLGNLHRVFKMMLGDERHNDYIFALPDGSYESQAKDVSHPDMVPLRVAFENYDAGFYIQTGSKWGFYLRRARVFSQARCAVELIRTELYPPGGCATPEEYGQRLAAGDLSRAEPFEVLERRLAGFADGSASCVGPYSTLGITLPTILFAVLLDRQPEPASVFELTHRVAISDYDGEVTLPLVRRAIKKAPFQIGVDGLITLDHSSPAFAKSMARLEKFRVPEGPKLLAKRFTSQTMEVQGQTTDIVLVIDDGPGLVHACQVCHQDAGHEYLLQAIEEAAAKVPEAQIVVIDDLLAYGTVVDQLDLAVEYRLSVDEVREPFQALEQRDIDSLGDGGYCYPRGLSQTELADFCAAAQRYYLLCPWITNSDADVFEIVGLTPKPLIASILGQAHEVYGLSLFESVTNFLRMRDGDIHASYCFMDFIESTFSRRLREELRQAGANLLDEETCPFAYGVKQPATATQVRILTEALNLVSNRFDERGRVAPGTTEEVDSKGRPVRVTFPVSLEQTSPGPSSTAKPGRNDPCWCGSGKKYKKCHGDN